jgi:putrescine aminotransferase
VAALTNLDILEEEDLLQRSRTLEGRLHAVLRELGGHPLVAEVRTGVGLLGALAIDPALLAREPGLTLAMHRHARERGLLVRPLPDSLAVSPPLIAEEEHIELIGEVLEETLDLVLAEHGSRT